ncbi:amino acid permease [Sphingomonas sp. RP10(2022)]|uniref:Amino acid permease n=1 Tax=Sphingomonas liriopis TaxID=2949094 RepID=A0A9X2HUY9_9SPHN|nr:amino acid permease [Sphingomonas liriopis]MCP3736387.1 amino acid permease [Sphingomonas liriopis]
MTGLKRTLGPGQLAMIAIGGAIGTGLFLGSGFAIQLAGPAVLVSYAIGGLVTLSLMGCLAEMTVADPATGSFGLFAERYLGRFAGFLVRYAYVTCIILAIGTEVTAVAIYMRYWAPEVPGLWWIAGFALALLGVNLASVRAFGAVEYLFSAIKIAAILAFILLGGWLIVRNGTGLANYTAHGGFAPHGIGGIWTAVIVSIFSYLSIEMIAVAAGEARDPERAIVRAFRSTMLRLALFYLGSLAVMLAVLPWTEAGTATSPFVTVMAASGLPYAAGIINAVVLVAALSAMNSQLYTASRMLFSLAESGLAPVALARVDSRGVPVAALLVSAAGIAVAGGVYAWRPDAAFGVMIAVSIFGALFTWGMIFVTHLAFRRRHGAPAAFRLWGHPWTSLAGALAILAILLTTPFTAPFALTLVYGVPFLAVLAGVYLVRFGPLSSSRRKSGPMDAGG